ncbi:hypothetical protein ZWY2020_057520 [Hordeum vulgare]|nr:hypothetical protein ZWY2020_057520 [Hordeum vulgare]
MITMGKLLTFLLCILLFEGWMVQSVPYDYTASIKAMLEQPDGSSVQRRHYREQRVRRRPDGLVGALGRDGQREQLAVRQQLRVSEQQWPVAQRLTEDPDGNQPPLLPLGMVAGFFGYGGGESGLHDPSGAFIAGGATVARSGCWSMLKGGMTASSSGPAELFFEADGTVDIWVDSVSLQPFSFAEWEEHRRLSAGKAAGAPSRWSPAPPTAPHCRTPT